MPDTLHSTAMTTEIHKRLQRTEKQWYVRTTDGAVYGPAPLPKLTVWAAEARIVPGCSVSDDGSQWVPAEGIAALRMEWDVELSRGETLGPLHLLAVCDLIRDGVVQRGAALFHRPRKLQATVDDTLFALIAEQVRGELLVAVEEAEKAREELSAQATLHEEIEKLEATRDRLQLRSAAQEQELQARAAELEQVRAHAAAGLKAEETARQLRQQNEELTAQCKEVEGQRAAQVGVLEARNAQLERECADGIARARQAGEALDAEKRAHEATRQSADASARELQKTQVALNASSQALDQEREQARQDMQRVRAELDLERQHHTAARARADETARMLVEQRVNLEAEFNRIQSRCVAQEEELRVRTLEVEQERERAVRGVQQVRAEWDAAKAQDEYARQRADETIRALTAQCGTLEKDLNRVCARCVAQDEELRALAATLDAERARAAESIQQARGALDHEKQQHEVTRQHADESMRTLTRRIEALEPVAVENAQMRTRLMAIESEARMRMAQAEGELKALTASLGVSNRALEQERTTYRAIVRDLEETRAALQATRTTLEQDQARHAAECEDHEAARNEWLRKQSELEGESRELLHRVDDQAQTIQQLDSHGRHTDEDLRQWEERWKGRQAELESRVVELTACLDEERHTREALAEESRQAREALSQQGAEWKRNEEDLLARLSRTSQSLDEIRRKAGQDKEEFDIRRKLGRQMEQDLRTEIEQLRKESASTAVALEETRKALLQHSREKESAVNWLASDRGAASTDGDSRALMGQQILNWQDEARLASIRAEHAATELEKQKGLYAALQEHGAAREQEILGGTEAMKRELESSAQVLAQTVQEIERREEEYRAFQHRADERESNLKKRLVELQNALREAQTPRSSAAETVEPEVLPPIGRSRRDERAADGGSTRKPHHVLVGMEAQAQVELDAWHRNNADDEAVGARVAAGIRRWLRRRKS